VRPRTILYAAVIAVVGAIMTVALATRHDDGLSVIHDRNPLYVKLSDGALRNGYAIRVLNKTLEPQSYELKVSGLSDAEVEVIGSEGSSGGNPIIFVGADQTREMRVLVTTHQRLQPDASIPLTFSIVPAPGGRAASAADHFIGP
jgi:polyferredoxin